MARGSSFLPVRKVSSDERRSRNGSPSVASHDLSPARAFVRATLGGTIIGGLAMTIVLSIAWQHNPQGEFHDAGVIHWAWIELGLIYLGSCVALGALVGAVWAMTVRKPAG